MASRRYELAPNLKDKPWYLDKIGSVFHLSGLIFRGQGNTIALYFPDSKVDTLTEIDNISYEQWNAILKQSDNPLFMIEGQKPWIRKSQYVISGFVQQKIWVRDNFQCMYCKARMGDALLTIDHFVPLELGGENQPDNYLTACRRCNKDKGAIHPQDWCMQKGYDYDYLVEYLEINT